ncbi:ornithine decarboxylase [Methanohalophilus levihalophilus]|uniref:decarboxylase n=1 Tax=Methanohalophilus levihalophilus TaxID=1431282 RepID=UPI001AE2F5B0|nr:decarboxylase [Methanohalophilus levihalophilus]MBP2030604.1 ornithine decarboxylase [Methanohalophilus levihalophilus]
MAVPEPRFVLSKNVVLEQYHKVESIADIVSYSSKTNQKVSRILEDNTDCLFSVHMENELKHVRDMSRILFLSQGWTQDKIEELYNLGIRYFVVDNESDLDILLETLENRDWKINLMLRLKLKENSLRTERFFVFGMPSAVINQRIGELKENPKIDKLGIHFHRKTQNVSEWKLQRDIENVLSPETIDAIDILNIGGGLPSKYANSNADVIVGIFKRVTDFRDYLHGKNVQLMIEPGRFIAAPAGKLVTHVTGVYDNNVIVNASVYNSDMDAILVPVKLRVEGELDNKSGEPFVIKGCTPCSMDLFRYRVYLGKKPEIGDTITFINAGAYNFRSDFCDLEEIETEIVE